TLATGAANQRAAEEKALKDCNADPARNRSGGPCYLYAVQNRVVLPLRLITPMTPEAPAAAAPTSDSAAANPAPPNRQSPADLFRAALSTAITDIAPAITEKGRLDTSEGYDAATSHKALAVYSPADTWRSFEWPNEAVAEQSTLEGC